MLNKKSFFRFIACFFLVSIVLILILGFFAENIDETSEFTAKITSIALNSFGIDAAASSNYVSLESLKIEIVPLCTGYISVAVLWGFMLSFPAPAGKKLAGIAVFTPLVYLGNISRLVTSFYAGNEYGSGSFFIVHDFFWQFGIMAVIVVFLALWLHFLVKKESITNGFK